MRSTLSLPRIGCGLVQSQSRISLPRLPGNRRRITNSAAATGTSIVSRLRNLFLGTTFILGGGLIYYYITDTRASAHRWMVVPAMRLMYDDAEDAHGAGNRALGMLWHFGLYPRERKDHDALKDLEVEVFGTTLRNPIATSAGIDKGAEIPDPLFTLGAAIVEVGGATPYPQDGNEKPRVFRLPSQNAMINRYGLNSEGADHVAMRLRHRVREYARSHGYGHDLAAERLVLDGGAGVPPGSLTNGKLMAVNIAKNKLTPENDLAAVSDDYVYCVNRLGPYADIIVVNVSSPNTPGLRTLQQTEPLTKVLTSVVRAAKEVNRKTKPAVMVKVSPDEDSDSQIEGICEAVWASGVDGVIVGNTTKSRPDPLPTHEFLTIKEEQTLLEQGGYSGPALFKKTVALTKKYRKYLDSPSTTPSSTKEQPASRDKASVKTLSAGNTETSSARSNTVEKSIQSGVIPASNPSDKPEAEKKPLIQLPERITGTLKTTPVQKSETGIPKERQNGSVQPKTIFATGGITNGQQALEVLNAGANVAMIYTALVYGGVGTISRIKDEMRVQIRAETTKKRAKS